MDKVRFLQRQHQRVLASGLPVAPQWRVFDNFLADLYGMTPSWQGNRYLGVKSRRLGYVPDNVEWHFEGAIPRPPLKGGAASKKSDESGLHVAREGQ